MNNLNVRITLTVVGIAAASLLGPVSPAAAHSKGIYATEAEAADRAEEIGCTSVHQNNGRWMPCGDERELHRQLRRK